MKIYKSFFKRFFDISISLCVLIVLSPFLILISIVLYFANKEAGIFFKQERTGLNGKTFKILKFKSMTDEKDADGNIFPSKDRVTKIGKIIRLTSIDELPQLINILKGEMSLIGPRPLFAFYQPYYTEREKIRHTVRPGITGLSQISGRNNLSLVERLELDVQYIEKLSLILDIQILFKTVIKVIKRENIIVLPDATKTIPLNILRANKQTK
jgi:lipopolysaccharide/colanic/teichoic acid biosynthesis glycosyltransferase